MTKYPRITIAGLGGDNGKTLISLGLITYLRKLNHSVRAFKKGPDYIDAAWLSYASGNPARNLDVFMMGKTETRNSFLKHAVSNGINIIEGNRGIFDGVSIKGEYSTAELARLLESPVILVVDATKVTRTLAASVLGVKLFDQELNIAGVIVNKINGARHQKIVVGSIEKFTGIPVIGAIPELKIKSVLPSRHLGLVTPEENEKGVMMMDYLGTEISKYIDTNRIIEIAESACKLKSNNQDMKSFQDLPAARIGYFHDSAFTFYYPDNLESLQESGAELVPISALTDVELPEIDLLYIGGGFPETHIVKLSENLALLNSVREAGMNGLPIYAECGGLIYLSHSFSFKNKSFKMCNILPLKIKFHDKPAGHGYCQVEVDNYNPFFPLGTKMQGHEFHYTDAKPTVKELSSAFNVTKGAGTLKGRDGLVFNNVFASYFHFHSVGNSAWAKGLLNAARKYKNYY